MLRHFLTLSAIFSLIATTSVASSLVAPIGVIDSGNSLTVAVVPSSTIVVTLDIETEDISVGPYARYAQKLLGVRAPLVAKCTMTIVAADVELAPQDHYIAKGGERAKEITTRVGSLPVDATSNAVLPTERAAEKAADEIFKIRRTRREMILGDLGEGFFGGGLDAALERLDLEEQNLMELFMGRTTTIRESRKFDVALEEEVSRYIVCRYSAQGGVVDSSDLTAEPILLQVTPSGKKPIVSVPTGDKPARRYRIADRSNCEIFCGSNLLGSNIIPLFEFGYDVSYLTK